jgi:hypothetical protein
MPQSNDWEARRLATIASWEEDYDEVTPASPDSSHEDSNSTQSTVAKFNEDWSEDTQTTNEDTQTTNEDDRQFKILAILRAEDILRSSKVAVTTAQSNYEVAKQNLLRLQADAPPLVKKDRAAPKRLDKSKAQAVLDAFDRGHTPTQIAEHYNTTPAAIRDRIRRSGREL